jgi:putative ABC transport system permease protein
MMKTRYWKVIRDLTSDYAKSSMLILAIAIGVFGIGTILGSYSVIKREMAANYLGTNPASATLEIEGSLPQGLTESVKKIDGIKEAERHATVVARMKVEERWYPILLFVVDDYHHKRTNRWTPVSGDSIPLTGSMLVEQTALAVMQAKQGDEILIKTSNGAAKKIKVSGTVHDPGLAPAWQEQSGYGYITLSTLHALGESQGFDQLRILVNEKDQFSREYIKDKATSVAHYLKTLGYAVHEIQVPPAGKHPHQSQMSTVMSIFIVFSFLILILSSILVSTSMTMIMVKQIRQIGVMKTIGANSVQVTGMYLLMIVLLCLAALIIAIPLSQLAAVAFYNQLAVLLNLEIKNTAIPYWVPLLQAGSGMGIPLIAAAVPVIRGSRISVKSALDNYGVALQPMNDPSVIVRFASLNFLNETFLLSIRNAFRQRSRLALTLGLLAAGGAMFMTALNVSEAWEDNLKRIYLQRLYDLEVRFTDPVRTDTIVQKLKKLPGVKAVEAWDYAATAISTTHSTEITATYPDKGHGSFTMLALPVGTPLLNLTLTEGRWLNDPSARDVVLNQSAKGLFKIDDRISLSIEGIRSEWKVIGFTEDIGSHATAYVSIHVFSQLVNTPGKAKMLRIAYDDRSKENAIIRNQEVEALLERANISVASTIPVWLLRNAVASHMKVLVNSLLAMAIMMALVGTLGLMSTMSMSVFERTREIGVMRAIGATPVKIRNLIVWEGLLIGGFSIGIAFILSLLLSSYMGKTIGNMAFRTPLSLTVSFVGLVIWIIVIVLGSWLATLFPARRAGKITIREALAYE